MGLKEAGMCRYKQKSLVEQVMSNYSIFADNLTPEYVLRSKQLACIKEFVYFDIFVSRLQTNAII